MLININTRSVQFVPRDTTVIIAWNLASAKTTSSCVIRPRVVSADMATQVYEKYM